MSKLIHSAWFADVLGDSKIVILDGGARGSLFPPFDTVNPSLLQVIKVEPDAAAEVTQQAHEVVLKKAIWKEAATIPVHIAEEPSVSSVYPPDMELAGRFIDIIGAPARRTKKVVEVEAASIDALFEQENLPYPDFIKLDIHGCEYEALSGALKSLETKTVALIIESWIIEAHRGQQLLFRTDELLHRFGFYPHETHTGNWDYKNTQGLRSKAQAVISESLYFRDVVHNKATLDRLQGIKLIAIAELHGHVGFALLLADYLRESGVLDAADAETITRQLQQNNRRSGWAVFSSRVRQKLIRMLMDK